MVDRSVAILLSTYNGERYLNQQIDSIIDQTYQNWYLYIRDDGSNDKTISILKKYEQKHSNITVLDSKEQGNLGVVHSFMYLLQNVEADFYMFADQDDVWKQNKVENTVKKMLEEKNQNVPICVHTNLSVVDRTLKKKVESEPKRVWSSFQKVLFSNCVTGCTAMINNELKSKIRFEDIDYSKIAMHDWWIALIAAKFGKLIYLKEETVLYRQHGDNVDGSQRKNTLGYILYRLTHYDHDRKEMLKMVNMANEFWREYGEEIQDEDGKYLREYGELPTKSSFTHNLSLIARMPPKERTIQGTLFYSYLLVVFNRDLLNTVKK